MFKKENKCGVRHGKRNTRLYIVWISMKQRCLNPKNKDYRKYGKRGITICDKWKNDFMSFYNWVIEQGYDENAPKGMFTIDRIDNDGNYEPSNCRLASIKVQSNNKRNNRYIEYNGEIYTLTMLADKYHINPSTFSDRLERGWTLEQALTISPKGKYKKVTIEHNKRTT